MALLVGIDEAGYGPSLGPLVVAATVWRTPAAKADANGWAALAGCVRRAGGRADHRLAIDDSKTVYDRKKGIHTLERAVLAATSCTGVQLDYVQALIDALDDDWSAPIDLPWYHDLHTIALPLAGGEAAFEGIAARLDAEMDKSQFRCVRLLAEIVTEPRYNARVGDTHNKAAVLIEQVLRLMYRAGLLTGDGDVHFKIDRLGGRSEYRSALLAAFPDRSLHELEISDERSRYRLANQAGDWFVEFAVDADKSHLPVALASMTAKYVREAVMQRFNAYWKGLEPDLRPTAGYYTDAQRFLRDIAPLAPASGISTDRFVRAR